MKKGREGIIEEEETEGEEEELEGECFGGNRCMGRKALRRDECVETVKRS